MPYIHLDLPGTYPVEVKRELDPCEEILRDGNWAADWTPAEAAHLLDSGAGQVVDTITRDKGEVS
jgi:hypothetical protein